MGALRQRTVELDQLRERLQEEEAQAAQALAHHSGALERLEHSEHQFLEESLYHRDRSHEAEIRWQTVTDQARELEQSVTAAQALAGGAAP